MVFRRSANMLMVLDACWVSIAMWLALALDAWRRSAPRHVDPGTAVHFLGVVVIWSGALLLCGAYDGRYLLLKGRNLTLTLCGSVLASVTSATSFFLVPSWHMSRLAFLSLGLCTGLGLVVIRARWLATRGVLDLPEFIGVGDADVLTVAWRELSRVLGLSGPLCVVRPTGEATGPAPGVRFCRVETALTLLSERGSRFVVLTDGTISSAQDASLLTQASFHGAIVAEVFSFYETYAGRAPIFRSGADWVCRICYRAPSPLRLLGKRIFDAAVVAALAPLAAPVVLLAAAAVALTSPGPVFFAQRRVGCRGREFPLIKLRTMEASPRGGSAAWTTTEDPRITPVGRLLRATGVDELPQLWNVLRGDMSLVGPRPEQPRVVQRLCRDLPLYMQRHAVPCGLTGWAQVHRGSDVTLEDVVDKLRLDLYYARNCAVWFDVLILLRTFQMLLARAKPAPAALVGAAQSAPAAAPRAAGSRDLAAVLGPRSARALPQHVRPTPHDMGAG